LHRFYLGVVRKPRNSGFRHGFSIQMLRTMLALSGTLLLVAPAVATAGFVAGRDYRRGEVVVRTVDEGMKVVRIRDGASVWEAAARLRLREDVKTATPNWIARTAVIPDDPGRSGAAGGWTQLQWNFLGGIAGVNAPEAWDNLIEAGRPGGRGVLVAVVDTGVAYRSRGRFRRSPDITRRIEPGYDFVDNDRFPLDHNGHGTHVASTIAEQVDNGVALTGLAYGATIMPVRVLDRRGEGDSAAISSGIRYAAKRGARIINLSFEFAGSVRPRQIPDILAALRFARKRGALVVAASGNAHASTVAYPARAAEVLSVGAITEHGCQAAYSNSGDGLDISAPGGGLDAILPNDPNCRPDDRPGRDVFQMTFQGSVRRFGIPGGYEGTSMAAPHVSATAALVIASGVIGARPSPPAIEKRLEATAFDLGAPGRDRRYGAGRVDAAAATAAATPVPTPTVTPTPTP
jgi:serine protease